MSFIFGWVSKYILVFTSLFAIVDPFAIIPTFLVLTKNNSDQKVKIIIKRACIAGAEILIFFQLFGSLVFFLLGIKLDAFKVAGGILLFLSSLDMLKAKDLDETYHTEVENAVDKVDISIVPLAIPLLSGPGAITSIIVFSNEDKGGFIERTSVSICAVISVFVISFYILKYSSKIKNLLGTAGISVMQRIMGILLSAISLQMIIEGISVLVKNYIHI
jgi:multiple antibiotic resistance protein